MSSSSLYGITKDYKGKEIIDYKNSWYFSPVVWSVLSDKLLPRKYGYIQNVIGFGSQEAWKNINNILNNSDFLTDRVLWELSNQEIFKTKDKNIIADCIRDFLKVNSKYDKSDEDNVSVLKRDHIIERWNEIATDIENLNEEEFPFFVFKNTSCDDSVESWFIKYNEESDEYEERGLNECQDLVTEFVIIENDSIVDYISNLDWFQELVEVK